MLKEPLDMLTCEKYVAKLYGQEFCSYDCTPTYRARGFWSGSPELLERPDYTLPPHLIAMADIVPKEFWQSTSLAKPSGRWKLETATSNDLFIDQMWYIHWKIVEEQLSAQIEQNKYLLFDMAGWENILEEGVFDTENTPRQTTLVIHGGQRTNEWKAMLPSNGGHIYKGVFRDSRGVKWGTWEGISLRLSSASKNVDAVFQKRKDPHVSMTLDEIVEHFGFTQDDINHMKKDLLHDNEY